MNGNTLKRPRLPVLWGYLAPGVLWYCFMVLVPLVVMVSTSLYDWRSVVDMDFIGLANYQELFVDRVFIKALKNNLFIIAYCLAGQVAIGFIISLLVNSTYIRGARVHRVLIFLPVTLSAVVVGFIWMIVYNRDFGILNALLRAVGLERFIAPWLDDPQLVMKSVSIPLIWQYIGFNMVIYLAGLQGIPSEIIEVSQIDGANPLQRLWYIILPLLKNTFRVVIMLCIAGNMKIFDHIFAMTSGGPGTSSMVLALYAFRISFKSVRYGYGSAISVAILVISLVMVFISRRVIGGVKDA